MNFDMLKSQELFNLILTVKGEIQFKTYRIALPIERRCGTIEVAKGAVEKCGIVPP